MKYLPHRPFATNLKRYVKVSYEQAEYLLKTLGWEVYCDHSDERHMYKEEGWGVKIDPKHKEDGDWFVEDDLIHNLLSRMPKQTNHE